MSNILILDIETAPKLVHVWGLFKQNVGINQIVKDMYVLNWTAKWLGDDHLYSDSLHYHKLYDKDPEDDTEILKSVWKLLDKADYIVAHNGARFDLPTLNSRFILQGMQPPSPYTVIDTLRIAKNKFKFTSNKLDFLAQALGVGCKVDTGGFELWSAIVLHQDKGAFDKMVEYCENDTLILEEVYKKLRPWNAQQPKVDINGELDEMTCNACGSSKISRNGHRYTPTGRYQRFRCTSCGHAMRSRYQEKLSKEERENILRSC